MVRLSSQVLWSTAFICLLAAGASAAERGREKIGHVLGRPVYRDEITNDQPLEMELELLFVQPVFEAYVKGHPELKPTEAELREATAYLERYGLNWNPETLEASDPGDTESIALHVELKGIKAELKEMKISEGKREYLESNKKSIEQKLARSKKRSANQGEKPATETREASSGELDDEFAEGFLARLFMAILQRSAQDALKRPGLSEQERRQMRFYEIFAGSPEGLGHRLHRAMADELVGTWKFERHVYEKFGGGRVLYEEPDITAFDADQKWLASEEKQGHFAITDAKLREAFDARWKREYYDDLTDDKAVIERFFLKPRWRVER